MQPEDTPAELDLDLRRHNLTLTPRERLIQNDRALAVVEALREAGKKAREQSGTAPKTE